MSDLYSSQPPSAAGGNKSGVPLINFQLENLSVKEKSDIKFGKQIAMYIEGTANGGSSSYFWIRNSRWRLNRNYANGRINMSRFQDLMEFNGKVNYLNLNWQCIHIVNRIISGLVGRWMQRQEKISVTAIDSLSTKDKQDEFEQVEFYLNNLDKIKELEQTSGVKIIPDENALPSDKEELLIWQSQFQRLPEEILYELGCNDVLSSNGWFDVLKEKLLHDAAETCFGGTYTWMDEEGVIHVEWCKPENCLYSYSNYPDFRDNSWRGRMTTFKISEIRRRWGQEFHPNDPNALTEEQLFQIAQTAKEYQYYDNISWLTEWNVTFVRPYDEWNVEALEFEIKTVDNEPSTVVTTKKNKATILKKGAPPKLGDNEQVIMDTKINIYRGVYLRSTQTMLEWGPKKNMIRPQDPKEIGNAEFSYSFYMAQNYDMMSLAVPEKIQEPADQMILARLKIQQLVASMKPAGALINWDSLQNIDYGLGEGNKAIDVKKLFDQTGTLYYRGRDAEGNPVGVPITELQNAGFVAQMQGLIELYNFHYQVLKDELGEDPNLITQAAQPRVAEGNIQVSQQQAEFATDYMYDVYKNVMADTARKVSCLLKDSVTYGAQVYRNIVNADDISQRIFTTKIQMLPDAVEVQNFTQMINQTVMANPDLLTFLNPFQVTQIAKENVKMAWAVFNQAQKKMRQFQQQTAQQNQQQTINGQIQSAQAAEQAKGQNMQAEMAMKGQQIAGQGQLQKETIAMQGVWQFINTRYAPQKGTGENANVKVPDIPSNIQTLIDLTVSNNIAQFQKDKEDMTEQEQQEEMAEQQQAQDQQMQDQQPQMQQQPPQQAA